MEEKDADNIRQYFANHLFSGFENLICVLISTETTVLIRSAKAHFFVPVEVR